MKADVKNPYLSFRSRFVWLAVFAVAMGFLEGIIVIYLRELYYPQGFDFPMKLMSPDMVRIEWIREIATLIMLAAVGILAGRNSLQRLFYFLFAFGVWDIIYYAALKLLIGWPASFLTWDLLFLIPWAWLGPVLAPVINSVTMIFIALLIIGREEKGTRVKPQPLDWIMVFSGAAIILYTYLVDVLKLIFESSMLASNSTATANDHLINLISTYIPDNYNWLLFLIGEMLIISATAKILIQSNKR